MAANPAHGSLIDPLRRLIRDGPSHEVHDADGLRVSHPVGLRWLVQEHGCIGIIGRNDRRERASRAGNRAFLCARRTAQRFSKAPRHPQTAIAEAARCDWSTRSLASDLAARALACGTQSPLILPTATRRAWIGQTILALTVPAASDHELDERMHGINLLRCRSPMCGRRHLDWPANIDPEPLRIPG